MPLLHSRVVTADVGNIVLLVKQFSSSGPGLDHDVHCDTDNRKYLNYNEHFPD